VSEFPEGCPTDASAGVSQAERRHRGTIAADTAGNLLEVGVINSADGPIIVHAMATRP
jgi:hypothetical protein